VNGVPVQRWRLVIRRSADAPQLTQRDATACWERALLAAGLPLVTIDEEGTRPRLAFGVPPGGSVASEGDLVDVWMTQRMRVAEVRAALTGSLPEGHALVDVHDVWLGEPALSGRVKASDVEVAVRAPKGGARAVAAVIEAMRGARSLPRERLKGDRTVAYDLRPFLLELWNEAGGEAGSEAGGEAGSEAGSEAGTVRLWMRLAHDPERGTGRWEEVVAEIGDRLGVALEVVRVVRTRLLLPEDVAGGGRSSPHGLVGTGRPGARGSR